MDTDDHSSESLQDELARLRKRVAELERAEAPLQHLNEVTRTLSESLNLETLIPNVVRLTFYEAETFARSCHAAPHLYRRSEPCDHQA